MFYRRHLPAAAPLSSLQLGQMLRLFSGHRDVIQSCDFSLNTQYLVINFSFLSSSSPY